MFLTDDFGKVIGSKFAGDYLIGHGVYLKKPTTAKHPCGTSPKLLPLLPSGPDGVHSRMIAQDSAAMVRAYLTNPFLLQTALSAYAFAGFGKCAQRSATTTLPRLFLTRLVSARNPSF